MRTTVDISDTLHEEARKVAAAEKTTMRALIEEGLRKTIDERKRRGKFTLRQVTFAGNGLHEDAAGASWNRIREMAYEGRGG